MMENASKVKRNVESVKKQRPSLAGAKKYLGPNDITEIAAEVGVTVKTVGNTLHGRSWNWEVAKKILERAEQNKEIAVRAGSL
jgi:hypothetical protein